MDLNVCSRRVHDGYATIRTRGRPRAVYRSDSEELLQDTGSCDLFKTTNRPESNPQLARWSNLAKDRHLENYGTLKASSKQLREPENPQVTLDTFSSKFEWSRKSFQIRLHGSKSSSHHTGAWRTPARHLKDQNESLARSSATCNDDERVYDSVPMEDHPEDCDSLKNSHLTGTSQSWFDVNNRNRKDRAVYAVPNVPVNGNYMASGDLYRSTVKYIEDVNRNIAEFDDESRDSQGVEKIKLSEDQAYRYRKRDMAPMPPISPDFGEAMDEKDRVETLKLNPKKFLNTVSGKRNSSGHLPPRTLPRSSSIDSTCRHSTGSTTTTSSTKSAESLYAIDESKRSEDKAVDASQQTTYVKSCIQDGQQEYLDRKSVLGERRYGTLPCRRYRTNVLHKSSEDVLNETRSRSKSLRRACCRSNSSISAIDVRDHPSQAKEETELLKRAPVVHHPTMMTMDATELILRGQMERSRFNSVERLTITYATLPRRTSTIKEQSDPAKRLSGTLPALEPLYEHAVSDPVKPRSTEQVIPWWELATRKYRHRSCPSLQAHVVSAFEQSLSNMTLRLQQLTATAEKKDSELQELRETIERLRKQSAEAGLNNGTSSTGLSNNNSSGSGRRHTLGDSESGTTGCTGIGASNHHHQNHNQTTSMARQLSADSVTSLNSLSSACSASSHQKKKGWLRSSFSKAFSRSRKNRHGSVSDAEDCKDGPTGELSAPNSPRLPTAVKHETMRTQTMQQSNSVDSNAEKSPNHENPLSGSKSSSALYKKEDEDVDELKKQLREKDLVLTDIRLEALSSAHQLESLKDTVIKMRNEMLNLKQNNERLQRLVTSKSLTSSQSSLPSDPDRRFSMTEVASTVAALSNGDGNCTTDNMEDLSVPEHPVVPNTTTTTTEPVLEQDTDGKRINVAVFLGSEKNFNYNIVPGNSSDAEPPHYVIANVCISNKTTWDGLDSIVRRCFKEYVSRVDPVTNLGLGIECVAAYHLGEASRCTSDSQHPELLPCGYLIGHVKTIYLVLSGYSWLAIDTLIPRSIVQRLVSLLTEHRRVILCGPSGTGKSYLAGKLAHALVDAEESKDAAAVATFNVDHKTSKELRQYLAHIAERCDSNAADELPRVIILENLQHAASLGELFSGLLGTKHSSCPAIIGTMSQATCSTTNLQLHHNFRWVLCANHMEPVKGFLGRYLRRKLLEHELRDCGSGTRNAEMAAVVEWLPRVWQHLNKFLETHSSSDVTIGPRLFLSCPMEVAGSQVWFTDLWNYSVIPYLVESVREGLTLYGRRSGSGSNEANWEDPAQFITTSYPWISTHAVHGGSDALLRLRPEDVGYDLITPSHNSGVGTSSVKSLGSTHSDTDGDPLLNMLMRLQEAANYSSPHSNDSDSVTSLDSSHTRHSEDLSSSTSSSRGVESTL